MPNTSPEAYKRPLEWMLRPLTQPPISKGSERMVTLGALALASPWMTGALALRWAAGGGTWDWQDVAMSATATRQGTYLTIDFFRMNMMFLTSACQWIPGALLLPSEVASGGAHDAANNYLDDVTFTCLAPALQGVVPCS